MSTTFKVLTPPTIEPVSVDDVKKWIRINWPDNDAVIADTISQARSIAETITHRAWATQKIEQIHTIERPPGGELSGALNPGPSWYQYNQTLGANPFGPTQFYFDIAMPPIQATQPIVIETKVTAFEDWVTFTGTTWVNDNCEPARIYFMSPVTANFYKFTYWCGYSASYPLPPDLLAILKEMVAFLYNNRDGAELPKSIMNQLLAKRVDWV